jgi:AcrR family transcriptional regulator
MSSSTAEDRLPRWQRRPESRPEEIIGAALHVFGEQGFARTRLEDVAKRAGVSKGTLYLYFKSKEDLFREMARSCVSASLAEGEEFVRTFQGSTRELLEQFIRRYWAKMNDPVNLRLVRVVHLELTNFPELARFYFQEVIMQMRSLIQSIIQLGIERGEFRPVNPGFAARALQTLCTQLAQYQHHFRAYDLHPMSHEELQSGIIDLYLNGVLLQPGSAELKEAV